MILSWCIITKGDAELDNLKKAIESVIDHVDEMCITTNGKEVEETKKYCATHPKIKYTHLDWSDNFAVQRNFCASQVRSDADFYGWMDSDDVILNPHIVRDVATVSKKAGYDTVFFPYWYGNKFDGEPSLETFVEVELSQNRERLIRPGSVVWKKRIHETPVPTDDANFKYSRIEYSEEYPVAWVHLGADRDIPLEILNKRMDRNRRLLEMELEDERKIGEADPRTLLYLMKIYAEDEDEATLRKCIDMGDEYMAKSGWDMERAVCCQLMSRCMGKLGDNEKARDLLHRAIAEFPYSPLLYLYLARTYYNLGNYGAMKHWMKIGMDMKIEDNNGGMANILELKLLSAELMLQYYLHAEKNIRHAYQSARLLNKLNPTVDNQHNEDYLYDQKELDIASEHVHKYMQYLESIQREDLITPFLKTLPVEIKRLPFANRYYNRYRPTRVWGENEVCYYATFGGDHFEKWNADSLKSGIGGSETAVIRLSQEWAKAGYQVTVYGDPPSDKIGVDEHNINWQPWYNFNSKDKFNIFVQWRNSNLANKVSAKKFLVDLHDVYGEESHLRRMDQIDKLMVKSEFHSGYAPSIPSFKKEVISNGIN